MEVGKILAKRVNPNFLTAVRLIKQYMPDAPIRISSAGVAQFIRETAKLIEEKHGVRLEIAHANSFEEKNGILTGRIRGRLYLHRNKGETIPSHQIFIGDDVDEVAFGRDRPLFVNINTPDFENKFSFLDENKWVTYPVMMVVFLLFSLVLGRLDTKLGLRKEEMRNAAVENPVTMDHFRP